jgi:hypothetical protein
MYCDCLDFLGGGILSSDAMSRSFLFRLTSCTCVVTWRMRL